MVVFQPPGGSREEGELRDGDGEGPGGTDASSKALPGEGSEP